MLTKKILCTVGNYLTRETDYAMGSLYTLQEGKKIKDCQLGLADT